MNSKMLLAPVLAFVLALLLAGAVSLWPHDPAANTPQSTPKPTPTPYGYTPMPTAAPSAADLYSLPALIISSLLLVVVIVAVILLYFRKEPK